MNTFSCTHNYTYNYNDNCTHNYNVNCSHNYNANVYFSGAHFMAADLLRLTFAPSDCYTGTVLATQQTMPLAAHCNSRPIARAKHIVRAHWLITQQQR